VSHAPPFGLGLGMLFSGQDVGSKAVRAFVEKYQPLLTLSGHIALIVPGFARGTVKPSDVSFNVYKGGGRWNSYFGDDAASLIKI